MPDHSSPTTIAALVAAHTHRDPGGVAFVDGETGERLTWRAYLESGHRLAHRLLTLGLPPRSRVGVLVRDGVSAHVAFLGCELAGLVAVGIGHRSGAREVDHLLRKTRAVAVVATGAGQAVLPEGFADAIVDLDDATATLPLEGTAFRAAPIADDELWFLNSTSGTRGLPKVVRHHQRRWFAFHEEAHDAARFTAADVFASVLPAPFGFGLWTAHFTPTIAGRPCVVFDRFDADVLLGALERERVTVLAAVPTQLALLLASPRFATAELSALRVVFTGGEMLPYPRAVEFEERTGAKLLQFYGSNETGALSKTTLDDDRDIRLRTAGRLLPSMHVRLVDEEHDDRDVTAAGGPAVPACKGPLLSLGYDDDEEANRRLYTADGWMKMGDLVTIEPAGDPDGVLSVVGRTSDLIIRGGKNISAPQVEEEVSTHPAVALAAAVPMPDRTFGERVCVYCVLHEGAALTLSELTAHLAARGVGKELWPEHLVIVDGDLPRSSGGKVAKGALREDVVRRLADPPA